MELPIIIYLSPFDILRPRTNQVSDVRFCEGFAQNGCEVHLVVPFAERNDNITKENVAANYGLTHPFSIHYLPTNFRNEVNGIRKLMLTAWYGQQSVRQILRTISPSQKVILISRNGVLLLPYITLKKTGHPRWKNIRVIHWLHDLKLKSKDKYIYRNADAILATNQSILHDLKSAAALHQKPMNYTLNPITQAQADEQITKEEARVATGLINIESPLIVYTGKIGIHYNKELRHLLDAASNLKNYTFLFTGGKPEAVKLWKERCAAEGINNIIWTGYISDYTKIKLYQYAADVLVSYYTTQGHDPRYNLPNKICEYMLTGNPIVTPDYPATHDLLSPDNCYFAEPENSHALTDAIRNAAENHGESKMKGLKAKARVMEVTFQKTAARLIPFFNLIP